MCVTDPAAVGLAFLQHYDVITEDNMGGMVWVAADVTGPFSVLIGLMTSFRLSDAFRKWEKACEILLHLHQDARTISAQLSAYLPSNEPSVVERVMRIRRYLVLGCTLIKAHVRGEKSDMEFELSAGLLTDGEANLMRKVCTVASGPLGDGKKDKWPSRRIRALGGRATRARANFAPIAAQPSVRNWSTDIRVSVCADRRYPSKNRPAFAFQEALKVNHELLKENHYVVPHAWNTVDQAITKMANAYEEC